MRPLLRLTPAVLLVALLAGCSDEPPAGDPGPSASATSDGSPTTGPVPKPVADIELANETLDFASATGGSADSLDVQVPSTHGNVSITFQVWADCPGGYASGSPRVVVEDAGGTVTQLWAYSVVIDTEPYSCSPASQFAGRDRASGTVVLAAIAGSLTVSPLGEFTGEVDIAVTVTA